MLGGPTYAHLDTLCSTNDDFIAGLDVMHVKHNSFPPRQCRLQLQIILVQPEVTVKTCTRHESRARNVQHAGDKVGSWKRQTLSTDSTSAGVIERPQVHAQLIKRNKTAFLLIAKYPLNC